MKSPTVVAASSLLSGILAGCGCPKCPETATTASAGPTASAVTNAPTTVTTAEVPPAPCVPSGPQGPQGQVKGGTYCVCNDGDHDVHGSFKRPHLAMKEAVIIPDLDLVTNVQIGGTTVSMYPDTNNKELNGAGNFPHDKTGGAKENVTHFVRIMPVPLTATAVAGCAAGKNTLKISFCSKADNNEPWGGCSITGDYGDTHVQN
jgi:hypothetical protein